MKVLLSLKLQSKESYGSFVLVFGDAHVGDFYLENGSFPCVVWSRNWVHVAYRRNQLLENR